MKLYSILPLTFAIFFISGCATPTLPNRVYPRAIYPLKDYPMFAESSGLKAAAIPFSPGWNIYSNPVNPSNEKSISTVNVLEAGLLPIRLILSNETSDEIVIDPEQIVGIAGSVTYRTYTPQEAVDLVVGSTVFKEAVKGTRIGPVVNSVLGGEILFEAVKGGASGVASGDMTGAGSGMAKGAAGTGLERANGFEKALIQALTRESEQTIHRQILYPGYITAGFIFLPSQSGITRILIRGYALNSKKSIPLWMELKKL